MRPISASWQAESGKVGQIHFDYLVDASGRNGLMSVKYLKNRCFSQSLRNTACWGYWTGTKSYMTGTSRENAVWIEALNGEYSNPYCFRLLMSSLLDESGWVWFIPLHDGSTSVGVVMDKDIASRKKKPYTVEGQDERLHAFYMDELQRAPGVIKLLGEGALQSRPGEKVIKTTGDFSYSAGKYAGDHYRIAGDAGGQYIYPSVAFKSILRYI